MNIGRSTKPITRSWVLLLLGLVVALLMLATPAHAQMRICKSSHTDSHDRERLRAAMQAVLPTGVSAKGVPGICRNPGNAHAWLSTPARLRADSATEWWLVTCDRETRQWECHSPDHRQVVGVYIVVDGILRRFEVSFDEATGLARARALAVRAVHIIQDVAAEPPPACGSYVSREEGRRDWEKQVPEYRFDPKDTVLHLYITSDTPGIFDVERDGAGLVLNFKEAGEPSPPQICWTESIVVT